MSEEIEKLNIKEVVLRGGYVGPTQGVSMRPMLKEGRDSVVVLPKTGRLNPLDVALYLSDGRYVLHRVIARTERGYLIRGDNCYSDEYVDEECVFGVLSEYFRKNKRISCSDEKYLKYAKRRVKNYPKRRRIRRLTTGAKRVVKRVFPFLKRRKGKKTSNENDEANKK